MVAIATRNGGAVARGEKNTERVDLRVQPSWMKRIEVAADRKGISVSAYLKLAASEKMDADGIPREVPDEDHHPKKKGKSSGA